MQNETPEQSKPTYEQLEQEVRRISKRAELLTTMLLDTCNIMIGKTKGTKEELVWKKKKQELLKF